MKKTTLCYMRNNGAWLMLYRNRKPDDPNEGKWLGIGGKIEPGETPDECNRREVLEETGFVLRSSVFCGIIRFRADIYEDEDMYLYFSEDFEPSDPDAADEFRKTGICSLPDCNEGELRWIPEYELMDLPMWAGDRVFLAELLEGRREISLTLSYEGEKCTVLTDAGCPFPQ